jgi:hypothetical protein
MKLTFIRRIQVFMAGIAAIGLAEQHWNPEGPIADLWAASTPFWSTVFAVAAVACGAALIWRPLTLAAGVLLAGSLWFRSLAIAEEFGWDLWGTVAQIWLTCLLLIGSWSWRGTLLAQLDQE